jgi:hypothetical protein
MELRQGIMNGITAWMEPMVESDIPLAELVQPKRRLEQWQEAIGMASLHPRTNTYTMGTTNKQSSIII